MVGEVGLLNVWYSVYGSWEFGNMFCEIGFALDTDVFLVRALQVLFLFSHLIDSFLLSGASHKQRQPQLYELLGSRQPWEKIIGL